MTGFFTGNTYLSSNVRYGNTMSAAAAKSAGSTRGTENAFLLLFLPN
jgi:hypothetical protein